MSRRLVCLLALLFCCLSPVTAAPGRTVITFWHAMRGSKGDAVHRLVEHFNRENPDLDVHEKFIGSPNQRYGNDYHALYQAVLEHLAQHQPPDVAQVYENWTTQLIEVGAITPIQKFLTAADRVDDLVPVFRQANTFNGTLYTMPFNKSIYVLYYNPTLMPQPPATLEALRSRAVDIARRHPGVWGLTFEPGVDIFGNLLYAYGGAFFDGHNKAAFSQPAGVTALSTLTTWARTDRAALPSLDAQKVFTSGQAAMYIWSSTAQVDMRQSAHFPVGVARLPTGTTRSYQFAGTNLAILAPPERQSGAARLIRFLASPDNTVEFAIETGYLPVHLSALHNPTYLAFLKVHPGFKVGLDSLPYAHIQPRLSAWESVRGILDDAVFTVLAGKAEPRDMLQRAAAQTDDLIRKLNGGH